MQGLKDRPGVKKVDEGPLAPLRIGVAEVDPEVVGELIQLVDRHLDHEEGHRHRSFKEGERLMPIALCPEQRVSLMTDLKAVVRGRVRTC
jgi:hypothetical protein